MNGECSGSIWGEGQGEGRGGEGEGQGRGRGRGGAGEEERKGRGRGRGSAEVMTLRESSKSLRPVLSWTLHVLPHVNLHCIYCCMYSETSE